MNIRMPKQSAVAGVFILLLLSSMSEAQSLKCKRGDKQPQIPAAAGVCGFDAQTRSFAGSPAQQATCLTRMVRFANSGIGGETISTFLENLVGKPAPSGISVQAYLRSQGINAKQVGQPVGTEIRAQYFVRCVIQTAR